MIKALGDQNAGEVKKLELQLHKESMLRETKEQELLDCQDELAQVKMKLLNLELAVEEQAASNLAVAEQRSATDEGGGGKKPNLKANMEKVGSLFRKK